MKKGTVCYVYYAIKNKRQLKLERERALSEQEEINSQASIYRSQ